MSTAWRKEPPTVEEVRAGLTWWWRRRYQYTDDEGRPVVESRVCEVFARGDTVRERLRGDLYAPNVRDVACEWSPCLPPATTSPPLAESTTIVHPDDGDGPWVQPPRMAVPRGVPGKRVRVVVMGDEPGEE